MPSSSQTSESIISSTSSFSISSTSLSLPSSSLISSSSLSSSSQTSESSISSTSSSLSSSSLLLSSYPSQTSESYISSISLSSSSSQYSSSPSSSNSPSPSCSQSLETLNCLILPSSPSSFSSVVTDVGKDMGTKKGGKIAKREKEKKTLKNVFLPFSSIPFPIEPFQSKKKGEIREVNHVKSLFFDKYSAVGESMEERGKREIYQCKICQLYIFKDDFLKTRLVDFYRHICDFHPDVFKTEVLSSEIFVPQNGEVKSLINNFLKKSNIQVFLLFLFLYKLICIHYLSYVDNRCLFKNVRKKDREN